MQPLASYNHGAKHFENIKKLLKVAMVSSISLGVIFVVLLNVFPYQFVSVFNSESHELVDYTVTGIQLHLFALALDGFLVVTAAYYQAINSGSKAMFVTMGNMLIQLPFLYIMPKLYGVTGIWLAYPLSNIALSVVVAVMLYNDVKRYQMRTVQAAI